MPNLFSALPVVILAWVRASTSGLTRMATATVAPFDAAISEMRSSSGSDSTLKQRMPVSMAKAISRARLGDAGEDDRLGRGAGGERPAQFALRNHVEPGALGHEGADHRLVGIGLHGVADERVEAGEGLAEDADSGA